MKCKLILWQKIGVTAGQNVLDIGFGDVSELQVIAFYVGSEGSVLGIDVDESKVQRAERQLVSLSLPNVSVKRASVLAIPSDNATFDMVICKGVLHEVKNVDKAVAEMARVCKAEGVVSIIDVQRFSRLRFELYRLKMRLSRRRCVDVHPGFTQEQLRKYLAYHQLEVILYEQLPERGHMGFNEVTLFLLKAKPTIIRDWSIVN